MILKGMAKGADMLEDAPLPYDDEMNENESSGQVSDLEFYEAVKASGYFDKPVLNGR